MAHRFEKGKPIYFLFRKGYTVQDSQLKPRYYLDREKAKLYALDSDEIIEYAPTLTLDDIVPHGRWEPRYKTFGELRCSNCGAEALARERFYVHSEYCPNCGAKMDLEEENA